MGSTTRVPATLGLPHSWVSALSPSTLLRLPAALYGAGPALSAVPVFGSSTKAQIRLRLRVVSSPASAVQAARGLGALSPVAARRFPPRRAARAARGLAPSLRARRAFSLRGERTSQPEASVLRVLSIFWSEVLSDMLICKYFLPGCVVFCFFFFLSFVSKVLALFVSMIISSCFALQGRVEYFLEYFSEHHFAGQ